MMRATGISLVINEKGYDEKELFKLWHNGKVFHNVPEYRQVLDSLGPLAHEVVRDLFIRAVFDAHGYIVELGNVIKNALDNHLVKDY
jgi:hypothetical protein